MDARERPWVLHFLDKQKRKVLYMDVLMLRSHGCEGAVTSPLKGEIKTQEE
jgi:hypothetical protein